MSISEGIPTESLPAILGGSPVRAAGPPVWPRQNEQVEQAIRECWETGDWGRYHGKFLSAFQQLIQEFYQTELVTLCSSGSSALELALRGLKVQPGDEVIMAGYDFKANFQNIVLLGAIPVLVDLRTDNFQIDVDQITQAITPKTKAILVSHLHGGVVNMQQVSEIAKAHQLPIVEDACQCQGALIQGNEAGMSGNVGIISFGGSKLTTAGRGGAVLTTDAGIHQRIKLHQERGNIAYPLSELQAAVLTPQWKQLREHHQQRTTAVNKLEDGLLNFPGLKIFDNQEVHETASESTLTSPGYYKVGFRYLSEHWSGLSREQFCSALRAEGIAFDPGFRSLHLIHSPRRFRRVGDLPIAGKADQQIIGLHHPVLLEPLSAIDEIKSALHKVHRFAEQIKNNVNE